jgi:type IV pilus assembly protein PilY1
VSGGVLSCGLGNGYTATCTQFDGQGTTQSPHICKQSFGITSNGQFVSFARSGTNTETSGNKRYYDRYNITYRPYTTTTYYYVSSYPGTTGSGYYYTSTYNLTWGAAQSYAVRVKVCDSIGYEENCVQYGSSRKPTGVVQDNGERMRFGVFSYYKANDIDNAVMRSKLKYVAPQQYSPSGTAIANPLAEWRADDGTLLQNPDVSDSATNTSYVGMTGNSGVINYINKFGRTAQSYKTYDNIGKLYYESLKYLRGLQATPDLYRGAKASNADGFPVITNWDDPMQYSCPKNYIITMGDTHTHCDKRLPGGAYTSQGANQCAAYTDGNNNAHPADYGATMGSDSGINVSAQTNAVGALEGMGNLATSTTLGNGASFHMAGLAKWGASTDTRTDLIGKQTVTSFIIDVEEYKDCGYNSQFWLAAKYGNPPSYDLASGNWIANQTPEQRWSQTLGLPAGACSSRAPPGYANDTGGNVSWPKNLLRAGDPLSMIASVRSAISQIAAQVGVESGLAQSSGSIDTGTGAYVYRAMYNSAGWTGDVVALVVRQDGSIGTTPAWSASTRLPPENARNIYTFNDGQAADRSNESSANARRGVAFTQSNFSQLSNYQQAALNRNLFNAVDNYGVDRIAFLRGSRDGEAFLPGTTTLNPSAGNRGFRSRVSVLGDFLNSTPLFVSSPQSSIPGTSYRQFAATNASRRKMLYVGGNDGMLHAFDASYTVDSATGLPVATSSSGSEIFAYVPGAAYSKLSHLSADSYSHKYYADGSPATADACFGNCASAADWKTVLVAGLNAGGQGIYALDVTNPDNFGVSSVLWEFNDQDDPDLGYTFGKPVIAKLNNNKWAVIFGNGYNNTTSDGKVSTTGHAQLYIAYIDGPGAGANWTKDVHYIKIPLKAPTDPANQVANPANGLGPILTFDKNLDDKVDYVYAGDRRGNLWKVDISSNDPSNWKSAFGTVTDPLPLFTATSSGGGAQQFTTGLSIARHPYGGFMIMAGTGSWIDTSDVSSSNSDTMYGIWDKDNGTLVTRSRLQKQRPLLYVSDAGTTGVTASGAACSVGSPGCLACSATRAGCVVIPSTCSPNYGSLVSTTSNETASCPSDIAFPIGTPTQLGWAYDLQPLASSPPALPSSQLGNGVGERTYSDRPSVLGNVLIFETLTPASDPCTGNTSGTNYVLSWLTGGGASTGVSLSVTNPSGKVGLAGNSYAGQGSGQQNLAIGGRAHGTGASKGAANLTAPKEFCSALPPGTPGGPPAPCTGAACVGYVPGWGFLSNLSGAKSQPKRCICAAQSEVTGNNTVISEKCNPKLIPAQVGRLTWKQISR